MMLRFTLSAYLVVVLGLSAAAQVHTAPPDTSYSFGAAKAHNHTTLVSYTGYFCGRGLAPDPTNNPGNAFFGNEICVTIWDDVWFWYDWSTDPDAGEKYSVWASNQPYGIVEITYDPECMLATIAENPWCCQ
jgi:hypothetical protein